MGQIEIPAGGAGIFGMDVQIQMCIRDRDAYRTLVLVGLGEMYHKMGWAQQYHIGALRNNNKRMFERFGPDIGFDSVSDAPFARDLSRICLLYTSSYTCHGPAFHLWRIRKILTRIALAGLAIQAYNLSLIHISRASTR